MIPKKQEQEALNNFGKILMEDVRDIVFMQTLKTFEGRIKSPNSIKVYQGLSSLTPEEKKIVESLVLETVDATIHHFLWMIEQGDARPDEMDLVWKTPEGPVSIRDASGWLCSEPLGEEGWIARFSAYPQAFAEESPPLPPKA